MIDKENSNDVKIEVKTADSLGDDKTAKITKPNKAGAYDNKKVVLNSATDSAIKPSDATRIAPSPVAAPQGVEETIQMDKSDIKDVPKIASPQKSADDATQKTTKPPAPISQTAKSKTIKLKPLKPVNSDDDNQEETLSMNRNAILNNEMPTLGASSGTPEEETIKIQKPPSSIPGAKETIKLRPSNATPPPLGGKNTEQETISMSKKTIRLVPKIPGETTDDSTQKTAKPSAPTVKLGEVPPAPAAPPSARTVKMPGSAAQPAKPNIGKKTLKLKTTPKAPAAPPAGGAPPAPDAAAKTGKKGKAPKAQEEKVAKENPKALMTIAAVLSFFLMVYYAWMAVGQWAETHQELETHANVPGLSGTVQPSK